jgi:predicted NBD/HSP70 family sugar kinase
MSDRSAGEVRPHVNALGSTAMSDLFQILRDGQPRTRSELAAITGLARTTVAMRIDALTDLGLVGPVGEAASTGGRPSSLFAITASDRFVIGVDIGASHVRAALSDITGRVLEETNSTIAVAEGPRVVLDAAIAAARELIERAGRRVEDLLAIGVGVPGPVEFSSGRPINPPIMPGWDRFDVAGWIRQEIDVPVLVDNDVNIMALGERERAWPEVDHLLFVKIATGIGAGVISGGFLQRGAQGTAGDIGHVYVSRGAEIACTCGNFGCLEALASGSAIARALTAGGIPAKNSRDVVDLVKNGNVNAIQAVRQAGRDVGEVLTTCVSLMNPSVIVLGGAMAEAGEHLIAGVREVVYRRSMPLATEALHITLSQTGADAAVLGATMLAIHHSLSPANIEAMIAQSSGGALRAVK